MKNNLWKKYFETIWAEKSYESQSVGSCSKTLIQAIKYSASRIVELLEINERDILAEIGASSGYLLAQVISLASCRKVYAIDYSEPVVQQGKRINPNFNWIVCSGLDIKMPSNTCDKTFANNVLHHMANKREVLQFVSEMIRITKQNGILMLGDVLFDPRSVFLTYTLTRYQNMIVSFNYLFNIVCLGYIKYQIIKLLHSIGIYKYCLIPQNLYLDEKIIRKIMNMERVKSVETYVRNNRRIDIKILLNQ